ncbi:MAG: 2-oxo acid dehydrogenase subunit E2, partial [Blastocatellia bacterium]|nr:2-oxo acid dehydrogenase subunit E2 [Blastocatellia bacterium]
MMYVALSYDHRIIDGKEAVGFLVKVKEGVEAPERLLFGQHLGHAIVFATAGGILA